MHSYQAHVLNIFQSNVQVQIKVVQDGVKQQWNRIYNWWNKKYAPLVYIA